MDDPVPADATDPDALSPDVLSVVDERRLPPVARMLARAIGLAATVRLLQARGGTQLHVPVDPARAQVLRGVLSADEITALASAFGALRLDLPKPDKVLRQVRDAQIRADRARHSAGHVARTYGLTRRHVINITGAVEPTPAETEQDLFGPA